MSLQSCPTCGYAVSTETLKCRHCLASFDEASGPVSDAGAWFKNPANQKILGILLLVVSVGVIVYLMASHKLSF